MKIINHQLVIYGIIALLLSVFSGMLLAISFDVPSLIVFILCVVLLASVCVIFPHKIIITENEVIIKYAFNQEQKALKSEITGIILHQKGKSKKELEFMGMKKGKIFYQTSLFPYSSKLKEVLVKDFNIEEKDF